MKITLKSGSIADVTIRNAGSNDVPGLVSLNQKWQRATLGENLKNGFVGAGFSEATFSELINRDQVVVADFENTIVGYYLLNDFSKEGIIGKHADFVSILIQKGKISKGVRVGVGAQVVVDSDFMGSGIRRLMLDRLVANMASKYDFLFGTIAKDNPRALKAHTRDGWTIIDDDKDLFFVVYKV